VPADIVVGEGDGYVDLPVRLSAPGLNPVAVSYSTASSTAGLGNGCPSDFVSTSGSLNFNPLETTKVVRVQLVDCVDVEKLISFQFTIDTPGNATIARAATLISIVNDSNVVGTPLIVVRDAVVDEKDGQALVPVLLGGPAGQASDTPVTVEYTTSDGTANAGADYGEVSGILSFAPGQTAKNVVVPIFDRGPSSTSNFAVSLSSVMNASIADGTGIVTINASAGASVPQPVLSAPPDITVGEGDGYVDLAVTLATPGVSPVTVSYATSNGTGGATSGLSCNSNADYVSASGTLNFAPGATMKAVRIQLLDCPDVEGTISFRFSLSNPATATIARTTTTVSIANDPTAWAPTNTELPAVTGLARLGQTFSAAVGSWTGLPTSYQITWQRCDSGGATCGSINGATGSSYVVTGADLGHSLRVQVTATNGIGTGPPAYSIASLPVLSVPGAPRTVTAGAGDGLAAILFAAPLDDGGGGITYTVSASPGGATATGTSSPIVVTGLTNGVAYTFTVTATNAAGTGPASAPSNPVIPVRRAPVPPDPPPPAPRPTTPDPPVGLPRPSKP
jgi:hypothetical protein